MKRDFWNDEKYYRWERAKEQVMSVHIEKNESVFIVAVEGNISQENVPLFRVKLQELLEEGNARIVLDMADAQYVSSIGLAAIIDFKAKALKLGGDIRLASLNYLVKNLFEITNLLRKFRVFADREEAVRSFSDE